ncbi:MAG: tetratricopeptide repeat protein [Armatimonadetes bacterium]|nr:tetratricopeptide repeat protein [Armatimonadota bacterium]
MEERRHSELERKAIERIRSLFGPSQGFPGDLSALGLPSLDPSFPFPLLDEASGSSPLERPPRLPHIAPVFPDSLKLALACLCQAILDQDAPALDRALDDTVSLLCRLFSQGDDAADLLQSLESSPSALRRVFYEGTAPLPHTRWLGSGARPSLALLNGWLIRVEEYYRAAASSEGTVEEAEEYLDRGEARAARARFSRILQGVSEPALRGRALLGRGRASLRLGAAGSARRDLTAALRMLAGEPTPGLVQAYWWRGRAHAASGESGKAMADLGRALENARRCSGPVVEILRERLALSLKMRCYPEALDDLERLLALSKESAELRATLARLLERVGRREAAASEYRRAAALTRSARRREDYLRRAESTDA